jgi:hypothetical protein
VVRAVDVVFSLSVILALGVTGGAAAWGEPIAVRFPEGTARGFLTLRGQRGDVLAYGDLVQTPGKDSTMESRLVFHFKDGSVYDETATFSQQKVFRLLAYRHIQRGKSFPETIDVAFDRSSGRYRARVGAGGETAEGSLDLPDDLHNGMTGVLLKNLPAGVTAKGHMLTFLPKPELLKTVLRPEATDKFFVAEVPHTATRYRVKMEIRGLTGVVARLIGKDPPDLRYWIATGPAPAFVKFEGAMFLKGPRWRIELGAPRWPDER